MTMYLEMTYIDDDGNARLTGVGAEFKTDSETKAAFERVRSQSVDIKNLDAKFILDLREDDGEIVDSLAITKKTFESVTGEKSMRDQFYVDYDNRINGQNH